MNHRDDIIEPALSGIPVLNTIVIVEDDPSDAYFIERKLRKSWPDVEISRVDTLEALDHKMSEQEVDIVLSDFRMPNLSGLAVLDHVKQHYPSIPVIVISGAVGEEMAVELIKAGASDLILKDRMDRLPRAMYMAFHQNQLKEQKEQADAEMQLVAYILSHDLRTPINNLTALNKLIQEELTAHPVVEQMEKSVASLKATIFGLGQLIAKEENNKSDYSAVSISEVLGEIKIDLEKQLNESNGTLESCGYSGEILTKRPYFKSILSNLVGNSIKYRKADVAPRIDLEIEKAPGMLIITVKDNGMGMNLETHGSVVFQPFKRLKTKNKDGFGLGLYIVKKQLESLNGSIHVQSKPGVGSEFKIKLPLEA